MNRTKINIFVYSFSLALIAYCVSEAKYTNLKQKSEEQRVNVNNCAAVQHKKAIYVVLCGNILCNTRFNYSPKIKAGTAIYFHQIRSRNNTLLLV